MLRRKRVTPATALTHGSEHWRTLTALVVLIGVASVAGAWLVWGTPARQPSDDPVDVIERACALPRRYLERIRRGHDEVRSEDITMVPKDPNFIGRFDLTSHSGPWDYLQEIPLVLYGPGHVDAVGEIPTPATAADLYPTVGRLVGADLPARDGTPLNRALVSDHAPQLIVVIVWDGLGRSTLDAWPSRWPNLRAMANRGVSYGGAVVGSSPSITSASHSSMATGTFPMRHRVTGNQLRTRNGDLRGTFARLSPDALALTTFADEVDAAFGNEPVVGLLAWTRWHLGLLGHGASLPGADRDELALLHYHDGELRVHGNPRLFETPTLRQTAHLDRLIEDLDAADGAKDDRWRDHDISLPEGSATWTTYSNPAWPHLQGRLVVEMLARGGYGRDAVPDLFMTNFKSSDLVGHLWGVDGEETGDVLAAQDRALGAIVRFLERTVGDFVVIVTADHGASRTAAATGAWPIQQGELIADIDDRFDAPSGETLIQTSAAFGLYLDRAVAADVDAREGEIAAFIDDYTIAENWDGSLPEAYDDRGDEKVFAAAWPSRKLDDVLICAGRT